MDSNLYEILGLDETATPEDVKKAYRRKALETHPDRLPPTATPEERERASEQFKLVNNAYEVLSNTNNRSEYDGRHTTREDGPFMSSPFDEFFSRHSRPRSHFPYGGDFLSSGFPSSPFTGERSGRHGHHAFPDHFTDPFVMFENFFRDAGVPRPPAFGHGGLTPFDFNNFSNGFHNMHSEHDPAFSRNTSGTTYSTSRNFFGTPFGAGFGVRQNTPWQSESHNTSSINGVQTSTVERVDWDGNIHVTKTDPRGIETYFVNGIQQSSPSTAELPAPQQSRMQQIKSPFTSGRSGRQSSNSGSSSFDSSSVTPTNSSERNGHSHFQAGFIPPEMDTFRRHTEPVIPDFPSDDQFIAGFGNRRKSWWRFNRN